MDWAHHVFVSEVAMTAKINAMDDRALSSDADLESILYPPPELVSLRGRLSIRYQGNRRYLKDVYAEKKDWMLEPFQKRGQAWIVEPLRNRGPEAKWAGEYAGKWLDAASLVARGSHDERLGRYAALFAEAIVATQDADGYLGIEKPAQRGIGWDVWNLWNVMIGLLTHYEGHRDEVSVQAARACGQWLIDQFGMVSESNHPFFTSAHDNVCNSPVIDQFARLYRFTHERKFLDFAWSVVGHYPHIDAMRKTNKAPLIHAYHLAGFLGGVVELAAADNREEELVWVERVWEDLDGRHLYPTGSLSYRESLRETAPNDTPVDNGQPEKHHQETCATVEWLFLNARLYRATGNIRYVQAMEKTIYNALLAAQSTDGVKWMYYTPLRYEKRWFTGPTSCCYWSGPRAVARLPEWVYALDGEGIRVNLFESSDATFRLDEHAVAVQQSSLYPESGKVTLSVHPEVPLSFALRLRIPCWTSEIQISINGQPVPGDSGPDGYYRIYRRWSKGDQIVMEFDVPVQVRRFLNDQYGVVVRGPEVLAADQRDNAQLDLDQVVLQQETSLLSIDPANGRRRYRAEARANGQLVQVVFTPYADCGGEGSRFRTAFPVAPRVQHGG